MTADRIDDYPQVNAIPPVSSIPVGGWKSLWQLRHTVATAAVLPGLIVINSLITQLDSAPVALGLIVTVALGQALVLASFIPQRNQTTAIVTCGAIPPVTMIAASVLLTEMPTDLTFGFLAVTLTVTGVAFRFFATTCST